MGSVISRRNVWEARFQTKRWGGRLFLEETLFGMLFLEETLARRLFPEEALEGRFLLEESFEGGSFLEETLVGRPLLEEALAGRHSRAEEKGDPPEPTPQQDLFSYAQHKHNCRDT